MRPPCTLILVGLVAIVTGAVVTAAAEPPKPEYLSTTLADRIVSVVQGWGELGLDTSVKPLHKPPLKLRIKDKEYEHGLGHHASGEIVVDLAGQFKTFQADVGIQWQGGQNVASVIFRVFVDERKVFDSGVMRENDGPRSVSVCVEGAEELRLVADDAGDGITCDCANWADARLIRDPAASAKPRARGVDIARFGCVATWDPKRMKGTSAGRTAEFPAEELFLDKELLPESDGTYRVPVYGELGCIGLRWDENRILRELSLGFADPSAVPPAQTVQLQIWTGESAWQGTWEPVAGTPQRAENSLIWSLGLKDFARGTQKVRWVFSGVKTPIVLKNLAAYTQSRWATMDLRVESTRPERANAQIELYNGLILAPAEGDPCRRAWERSSPLRWKVRYCIPKPYKADRTVLRFQLAQTAFGVAVEDLLENDCVYVPHAGIFVTREPAPVSWEAYRAKLAGQSTLLEKVRKEPDQTFARAIAAVHNPIQDLGPMMVSLACDNRKFVAYREGPVAFNTYRKFDDPPVALPKQWQLVPRFGSGAKPQIARHLAGQWLPVPVITLTDGGVTYRQSTCVVPLDDQAPADAPPWVRTRALGVAEFTITNAAAKESDATLALAIVPGEGNSTKVAWQQTPQGIAALLGDRLLALLDARKAGPLEVKLESATATLGGKLAPGASARCVVFLPAWNAGLKEADVLVAADPYMPRVESYWNALLQSAMQVELPDPLLTHVIRASQVHCLLAARNEEGGRRVSPWISSDRYGPLESEANSIIRGMGMFGHAEFAQRSLDFFIHRYNAAGFLTTGYTIVGTGEHLWTLAEHYERTQDRAWLEKIGSEVARVCRWIVVQRAKTKRLDARGQRVPEYGLMPPGVTADWNRYAYRFFNDAQYCLGLESAAKMLASIGHPDAAALADDARQYREDLLRAYHWTQARSPVVRLDSGVWVPPNAALLDCFGRVEEFLPREDGNRSWAYSVEVGPHHLAATGVIDPASEEGGWIADYLEDVQFLRSGMGDYPEEKNRKDPFNLGGFAKVQPYYCRIAELYALRDDVKPFIRSYFNAIPSLLSLENLSFWEHFRNTGGWNKTHETGWFLCQSRVMLVMERGDDLWLAPMLTNQWLGDGMTVSVRHAPTRFGKVSYTIRSAAARGEIEAVVEFPDRTPPKRVVLRVRHPEGKPIRTVTVNGKAHDPFDPQRETVSLTPSGETLRVKVSY